MYSASHVRAQGPWLGPNADLAKEQNKRESRRVHIITYARRAEYGVREGRGERGKEERKRSAPFISCRWFFHRTTNQPTLIGLKIMERKGKTQLTLNYCTVQSMQSAPWHYHYYYCYCSWRCSRNSTSVSSAKKRASFHSPGAVWAT